jgi:ClpA/ClpB-like protein
VADSVVELARRAADVGHGATALRAITELRGKLDELEGFHVANARRDGWSWGKVGAVLGVTRQAAFHRHARRAPEPRVDVTAPARLVVRLARDEASALGHRSISGGHLLLGLLRLDGHTPAETLGELGVTLDEARRLVGELTRQHGGGTPVISAPARRLLEASLDFAVRRGDRHLGPEHLLLSLVHARSGVAARVLDRLGVHRIQLLHRLEARAGTSGRVPNLSS